MTKVILILLAGLVFEAVGVVNLSRGLKQVGGPGQSGVQLSVPGLLRLAKSVITNRNMVLGITCQAVYFGAICYLLTQRDVSLVWPLSSLSFVFTGLAARLVLREEVSALRWTGILLVVLGAGIITWSEKIKERDAARRAAVADTGP
jgi:multidrug transporter EmrE-like cation transporter